MISIKKSVDQIEELERQHQAALRCYLSALGSAEKHLVPTSPDWVFNVRRQLKAVKREAFLNAGPEALERTAASLDTVLEDYCNNATQWISSREHDVKEIVAVMAEAAQMIHSHNLAYGENFRDFAVKLEGVCRLNDLTEMRKQITERVRGLKASVDQMSQQSEHSLCHLRGELDSFRARLEAAEALASTDHLTGVANRREGEKHIEQKVRGGKPLSILLFDLDSFKSLNDRYGHEAGDQVLKTFARRLLDGVRPDDLVCRWGGDEFVAVLGCGLREAMGRAKQLSSQIAGVYTLKTESRDVNVPVSASVGVADLRAGETAAQLFDRADALLYRQKALRTSRIDPNPVPTPA